MAQAKSVVRPTPDESVSTAVVRGVADIKGVDPTKLDECLYDYVDPGALDRLFQVDRANPTAPEVQVSFTMAGCQVTVYGTREVVVTDRSTSVGVREEAF